MPQEKLIISLEELAEAFERLPNRPEPEQYTYKQLIYKSIVPVGMPDMNAAVDVKRLYLAYNWDEKAQKWQMNGDNLIITP